MSHELSYNSWGTSWQGLRWEPELIKGDQRPVEEQQYFVLPQHLLYAPRQKVWYDIICSGHRCTAQYYRERGGLAQIMGKNKQPAVARSMLGVPDRLSHLPLLWQMGHQPDTMQCLQNMNATTFSKSHWRECPLLPATVAPPRPQPVYKLYNCQGQCLGCLMVSPTLTNEVCLCSLVRFSNHYFCWSIGEPVLPPLQPARFSN